MIISFFQLLNLVYLAFVSNPIELVVELLIHQLLAQFPQSLCLELTSSPRLHSVSHRISHMSIDEIGTVVIYKCPDVSMDRQPLWTCTYLSTRGRMLHRRE